MKLEPNKEELARDLRSEQAMLSLLCLPVILLIGVVIVIPFGCLFVLSFFENGTLSLAHYERLFSRSYLTTLFTTLNVSFTVTLACGLIGYLLAYFIVQLPRRLAAFALFCVMLPFWTAILVRTYAWVVILQRRGVLNTFLVNTGLIDEPLRLAFNFTGTVIGLVHIFLPFIVLPLHAAMHKIPPHLVRAAASMGATPTRAFTTVFFPLSFPALAGAMVIVFVLCLGSYVTPTILGGGRVIVWPMRVADALNLNSDWGASAALGVVLLLATFLVLGIASKVFRFDILSKVAK